MLCINLTCHGRYDTEFASIIVDSDGFCWMIPELSESYWFIVIMLAGCHMVIGQLRSRGHFPESI